MGQPLIFSAIDRAVFEYNIIEDGDRILIGASGGKDSTALIEYFAMRSRRKNCNFQYKAVAVQSDFAPPFPENIRKYFEEWNVPFEVIDVDIMGRLKEGRKMNCYWCSTQRRTELLRYAIANGYNKIALGHHYDDAVETFVMSLFYEGRISCFQPVTDLDRTGVIQIRPMLYIHEKTVDNFAKRMELPVVENRCPVDKETKREEVKKLIYDLAQTYPELKDRIFGAMQRYPLPEWEPRGRYKRPKEQPDD